MDDAYLPDDDLDLALAREVERGGASSDPLVTRLAPLRTAPSVLESRSAALWARIEADTRPVSRRVGREAAPRARGRVRWGFVGALASLLLLAVIAVATLRPWKVSEPVRFAVAPGGTAQTMRLPDGSKVALRPGSTLDRVANADDRVRYRLTGEALFDVAHVDGRTFEVETGSGVVAVLGTRFRVAEAGDSTTVTLERGRVALSSTSGQARVVLAPGEEATASPRGVSAPAVADTEAAMDWMAGRLHFRHTAASAVAAELERHYGITVDLPQAMNTETVSGSLALGTRDETLEALGRVLGGRFEPDSAGMYRFVR